MEDALEYISGKPQSWFENKVITEVGILNYFNRIFHCLI
ncbi:unnamed protein product [Enterobius vermicularis]|uniref:Uncharacterized protein n=1 Tax=Enterobius vermicularis TaxID=51028 RepID=A0A0N4V2V6_ENTVE|nr:unnamed protein product [Enterobius vermicularis]